MDVRRGTALAEVLVTAATVAAVLLVLLPIMEQSRSHARMGEDLSHMRSIAAGAGSYAADFDDKCFGLSWRRTQWQPNPYPDLQGPFLTEHAAAAAQLTYLVRTRGGRLPNETPVPTSLLPHIGHSGIALASYMDLPIPHRVFNSSAGHRWRWADNPRGYDQGLFTPNYGTGVGGGAAWRHPYSSDLRLGPAFFDDSAIGSRISPSGWNGIVVPSNVALQPRALTGVHLPSQKVLMHSQISWHFKPVYHMDQESRAPVLFVDGSASARAFLDANAGADPNQPGGPSLTILYNPCPSGPDPVPPGGSATFYAGPQWTRMMLQGRDFGGPEVYP